MKSPSHLAFAGYLGKRYDPFIANQATRLPVVSNVGEDSGTLSGGEMFQFSAGLSSDRMNDTSTIHIIDDDSAVRESLLALVQMRGLDAKAYSSAEAFLAGLKSHGTGCVVSDVRMPGMTGLQLLEKMNEAGSTLPVIIITAYADVPTAVRAMQAGAVTFLEKPCNDDDLIAAIQQALNLEQAQQALRKQKSDVQAKLDTLTPDENAVMLSYALR